MPRYGVAQRRARLAVRHHLAPSAAATDPLRAAESLVALHSTDPASVFLGLRARVPGVTVAEIEQALYTERTLLRMLGMRRTVFVVPTPLAAVVQAACTRAIAAAQRRTYLSFLAKAGYDDPAWLAEVEEATFRALAERGEATGAQLSVAEPRLRTQLMLAEGKPYESRQNITTWVLFLLAADGRIVRGRPLGSWTSTQWRWSTVQHWLPGGLPEVSAEQARAELARRWLAAFGPATVDDLRWWTGWTVTDTRRALEVVRPVEVDLDGQPGIVLADDLEPVDEPEPWVALLPPLDPTPMGWTRRDWFLGEHGRQLFDRSGNIGPSVWADGQIVGGWAQLADGQVVYRLLADVGAEARAALDVQAQRLSDWTGPVRATPRFRTPLEQALGGSRKG